jgi:hypothetical protein
MRISVCAMTAGADKSPANAMAVVAASLFMMVSSLLSVSQAGSRD